MGITGVVRDKDTEQGIADAVIAVEGINHDVTTGVWETGGTEVWEGAAFGWVRSRESRDPDLVLHSCQHGAGITGAC